MTKYISIVIPTLNAMRTLDLCLSQIFNQDYPSDKIEIVIADGGSMDGTIELIKSYQAKNEIAIRVISNDLITAEAGKAVGVRSAHGEIVALIDSDNLMPDSDWLQKMVEPFNDENIVASEPIEYTYRDKDSYINRYCALMGMNDPVCFFLGNYDRMNFITNKWTEVEYNELRGGKGYLSLRFDKLIPTMGANGFLMRKQELLDNFEGDYLFDIDVLWVLFQKDKDVRVAKVKTGIVHLFCDDITTYIRKQKRRINDFNYFKDKQIRKYPWSSISKGKLLKFCFYTATIIPLIAQAIKGHMHKNDIKAWAFHPVACVVTLWVYGTGTIKGLFKKEMESRKGWKQ